MSDQQPKIVEAYEEFFVRYEAAGQIFEEKINCISPAGVKYDPEKHLISVFNKYESVMVSESKIILVHRRPYVPKFD